MATHSSTLAWRIPWTEEPGRLQSMGSRLHFHFSLFTFMHWRRKWQPTPVLLPGESQAGGAWWAAVYVVAESDILKRLSSSSNSECIWMLRNAARPSLLQVIKTKFLSGGYLNKFKVTLSSQPSTSLFSSKKPLIYLAFTFILLIPPFPCQGRRWGKNYYQKITSL